MDKNTIFSASQRSLLAGAAGRVDGVFDPPPSLKRGPARRSATSLIERRLFRETRARGDMPVWREDAQGRPLSLVITKTGRDALRAIAGMVSDAAEATTQRETTAHDQGWPREGSKIATVFNMLCLEGGAGLPDLVRATGWQPHTIRAAITGLRKHGFTITRERADDGVSVYRATELRVKLDLD